MTTDEMHEIFEENDGAEFLKFDRIEKKLSTRPDLHAFLLLDSLCHGTHDMVSAAEHDEIFLEADPGKIADAATREQIIDLNRCGVRYDHDNDCFCMFA